jgi:hypothetical protein
LSLKTNSGASYWVHVGGSGDGGVDGVGFDPLGNPAAFLSVKWEINLGTQIRSHGGGQPLHVAYLVGAPPSVLPPGGARWPPLQIAQDVVANAARLSKSFANLLGV